MAGEVRKMDVRHLEGGENSDDGGENADSKLQDDAVLLSRAFDNLPLGIREHRQSLITDEHLPTRPKSPLVKPERRLSVPLELLTQEWPQLTTQQGTQPSGTVSNNLTTTTRTIAKTLVSHPESVYLSTTATRNDSIGTSRRDNSLDNDQPTSSGLFHHHHHETTSSSSSSYSSYTQTEDSRLDSRDFFSSHMIHSPAPGLPEFEYGDLIRQVRVPGGGGARRGGKKGKQQCQQGEIIQQPIPDPFSSQQRLYRVVLLTRREHDRVQKRLSRQWLFLLLILVVPCPWLFLLFGYGMMDEMVDWLTEGDVSGFGEGEKKVALWLGFMIMALWIGVGVGVGWVA